MTTQIGTGTYSSLHNGERIKNALGAVANLALARCAGSLSSTALSQMAAQATSRSYAANETVWNMGDPGEHAAVIVSGFFEISRYLPHDREAVMGIFGPSDVIGLSAVTKRICYPGSARALCGGGNVIKIPGRFLNSTESTSQREVHHWVREMLLRHEQIILDKVDILSAGSAESRLLGVLAHLAGRFGKLGSNGSCHIPIRLTRGQLARYIDVRVETVIRLVSACQRKCLLQWNSDGILIRNLDSIRHSILS